MSQTILLANEIRDVAQIGQTLNFRYPHAQTGEVKERIGNVEKFFNDGVLMNCQGKYKHFKYNKIHGIVAIVS